MVKMVLARGDDWEGLYVNGKLEREGHSIDLAEGIIVAIEFKVTGLQVKWCDLHWLHDQGSLPDKIEDVKWEDDKSP